MTCKFCGKQFRPSSSKYSRQIARFCSHSCAGKARWTNCSNVSPKEKQRVADRIKYLLQTGQMKRGVCEVCGERWPDPHHDDYSKPMEIRWLCRKHHIHHHQTLKVSA